MRNRLETPHTDRRSWCRADTSPGNSVNSGSAGLVEIAFSGSIIDAAECNDCYLHHSLIPWRMTSQNSLPRVLPFTFTQIGLHDASALLSKLSSDFANVQSILAASFQQNAQLG